MQHKRKLTGRGGQPDTLPFPTAAIRDIVLTAAGFDPVSVGDFMKKAADKLIEKLEAQTTMFFTKAGVVTDARTVEDNQAQIRAAAELLTLGVDVMALKGRQENARDAAPPTITIDLSGWTVSTPETPINEAADVQRGEVDVDRFLERGGVAGNP